MWPLWGGGWSAPCREDYHISSRAFHGWLPQPMSSYGVCRGPTKDHLPCDVGHKQDPHPGLGVPTQGVRVQSRSRVAVLRLTEQSQALMLTTLLLTGLNSTSKAGDVPVPIPAPSAPSLSYSGCSQQEALEGKSRHTKARWYQQLGSWIIQVYNNYSSSGICPHSQYLEINPSSLQSWAQRPFSRSMTQSHMSQKTV